MSKPKDSLELKKFKLEATKRFISAVEEANRSAGPKELEVKLGIGDGTGNVWCIYRRGARSMGLPNLLNKIKNAPKIGLLPPFLSKTLEKGINDQKYKIERAQYLQLVGEKYIYDPRPYELQEFCLSVKQLATEAHRLNDDHPAKDILAALNPLQELMLTLSTQKNEVVKTLKPREPIEELFRREVEGKWGEMVPATAVRKILGVNHGLEIVNGFATSLSVAAKMVAMRKEALDAANSD